MPDAGPGYILNPDGRSCFGQDGGKDIPLQSAGVSGIGQTDDPVVPAFGQPAFANLDPASDASFLMPATGVTRAPVNSPRSTIRSVKRGSSSPRPWPSPVA